MKLLPVKLISDSVWNCVYIPLMLFCALRLSVKCRALQFRALPHLFRKTIFSDGGNNDAAPSAFQAAATAISSAVGTGNIVGTAQAITLGGPGALFWMWISSFLGMVVKYAEVSLSVSCRNSPMDYINKALNSRSAARAFALCAVLASFGIGNTVQVSCITDSLSPLLGQGARLPIVISLAAAMISVFRRGTKGCGKLSAVLFPCMSFVFVFSALCVILVNISRLPQVLASVIRDAFSARCIFGSGLSWGIRRAALSNEAGLGSAALAHGLTSSDNPAEHGLWGIFEVFVDTTVICSLSGITLLCCPLPLPYGKMVGTEAYTAAVASVLGRKAASVISAAVLCLFSFSSVVGWSMYGRSCAEFLHGKTGRYVYELLFIGLIILSDVMSTEVIWIFSDLFNALMSLPNLAALVFLSDNVACNAAEMKLDE